MRSPTQTLGKALAVAGALIGVVTGLGTVVGWLASADLSVASLADVTTVALGWAAIAYVCLATVVAFVGAFRPKLLQARRPTALGRVAGGIVGVGGTILVAATVSDPADLWEFGASLVVVVIIAVWVVIREESKAAAARAADAVKTCPDCSEPVKSEALVCRYCGYRFEPRLDGSRP